MSFGYIYKQIIFSCATIMSSGVSQDNVSSEFNQLCVRTFDEIRAVFDSETASLDGKPLFSGRGLYVRYEYDLEKFKPYMQKFAHPPFTGNAGYRVLKIVLLEMNAFSNEGLESYPALHAESESNLISEILGRTLREKQLNGILRYFLEFLSLHHRRLLRDVLNYRGFIRFFPHGTAFHVPSCVRAHLVYTMVYKMGSPVLLQSVVKLDGDFNGRLSVDNCEIYGKCLFDNCENIWKITYLTHVFGNSVMLAGGGILHQYVETLCALERPFRDIYAVDTITTLLDMCPEALQQPTSETIVLMLVRTGAFPSTTTSQPQINAMLAKLCAHLQMYQLTHTRDKHDHTIEYYAIEHQLVPILQQIRAEKMRWCVLSQLSQKNENLPCPMHSLDENSLRMIYTYL